MKPSDDYFDANGIIKLTKDGPHPVENTPLYHATRLLKNKHFFPFEMTNLVGLENEQLMAGQRSHDNMTAVVTYAAILSQMNCSGAKRHIKYRKILPDYIHPRDFLYIAMLQNRWWWWLGLSLWIPLLFLIYLYMAVRKFKVRNGEKILKTDTEILFWIKLQLPKRYFVIHLIGLIIVPILKLRFGKNYFKTMMAMYYQEPGHPNRN